MIAREPGTGESTEAAGFGITDLEEALRGPDGRRVQEQILARLAARLAAVSSAIDQGLGAGVYDDALAIRRALASARDVVLRFPTG